MRSSLIVIALAVAVSCLSCGSTEKRAVEPVAEARTEMSAKPEAAETAAVRPEAAKTAAVRPEAAETAAAGPEAVETEAAETEMETEASFPTGEPLTLPEMFLPQNTAGEQQTEPQQTPGNQPPLSQRAVVMQVVNCNEWISLRTMPSTSADTISRIPLGEQVIWIRAAENGFYQVNYQGNTGYALAEYLVQVQ